MKFQLPYEITKLYAKREDDESQINTKVNYAFAIQENFDRIVKYLNDLITFDNFTAVWTDWTPTYSTSGDMTYTDVITYMAKYCVIDKMIFFILTCSGTTGGTASWAIHFTLPKKSDVVFGGGCEIVDGGSKSGTFHSIDSDKLGVGTYNGANWSLGASRKIRIQGFYKTV